MKKQFQILACFLLFIGANMKAQWQTTGNTLIGGEKLGGSSGNFPLDMYVNNTKYLSLTTGGNLNLTTQGKAYQINGQNVLWYNGTVNSNIFVGVGAGATNGATATNNTFVGYGAGNANSVNSNYTFIGYNAGNAANGGSTNTFVGSMSGEFEATGYENSFFGNTSGRNCYGCRKNVYLGQGSGQGAVGT